MLDITILIVTYDRPVEIRRTVFALLDKVQYRGMLRWHIADDSSPGDYLLHLRKDLPVEFTATVTPRKGWGANVNKALLHIETDLVFLCEDDYVAERKIDLDYGAYLLQHSEIGSVRYDGIAGHVGLNLWLKEASSPVGNLSYLEIDKKQSSHLNVYSNRPHLRHRRFHDAYGMYREGISLGATEEEYAHRVIDKEGPAVAITPDGVWRAFDHIGKSRQGTDSDTQFRN